MRARILWAATLAVLLFGLAVGPSSGSRGPAPAVPSSSWAVVASMPQDIYGAAAASNGIYSYAAGGYSTSTGTTLDTFYRYNPVNERWETYPAGDARRGRRAFRGLLPDHEQHLRVRRLRSEHRHVQRRDLGLRHDEGTWASAANMPAPRAFMASGYNAANGKILPGRRGELRPGPQAIDLGVRPCGEHVHDARAKSRTPVAGTAFGVIGGHLYLAGGHDRSVSWYDLVWDYSIAAEHLDGEVRHADADERRGQRAASGKLWSFGGEDAPRARPTTTVAYDPVTNSWTSGPSLNVARTLVGGSGDRGSRSWLPAVTPARRLPP